MATALKTNHITQEYLVDRFYDNELKLKVAKKWRSISLDMCALRDAQLAIHQIHRELKHLIDISKKAGFKDVSALMDEAHCRFILNGHGE
ncbi:hypothetical protein DBA29_20320 [Xenophilus aerolatus]|nr:hypothetical protein [Xenophilus aerolatus]